jgi:hypothetical protein
MLARSCFVLGGSNISNTLTDSTIEAKCLPILHEGSMVDFGFKVFTAVAMKNAVFSVVKLYSSQNAYYSPLKQRRCYSATSGSLRTTRRYNT